VNKVAQLPHALQIAVSPRRPCILGLTGRAGVGKDTVAVILAAAGWQSTSFANALRAEVAQHWHVDTGLLSNRRTKELPTPRLAVGANSTAGWLDWARAQGHSMLDARSPRWAMQQWGSFRRSRNPSHWVAHVMDWANHHLAHSPQVPGLVVTDVRMPNEAASLRALGAHIVAVHRPSAPPLASDTANDETEQHQAGMRADAEIHNDGTVCHLGAEVWRVLGALRQLRQP